MKFSVLIPAYNAGPIIDRTIQSVLNQSLPPLEILVVDDGSTDDTLARLKAYEPRITVYPVPNAGVSPARNLLCEKSRGEVIAFLDADDVWHPRYLETQARMLEAHPEAGATYTRSVKFKNDEDLVWPDQSLEPDEILSPVEFFRQFNRTPMYFVPSCCCVRRAIIANFGMRPFPELIRSAEDFYFFNLLPLFGPVLRSPAKLMAYRLTPGSLSTDHIVCIARTIRGMELLSQRNYRTAPRVFAQPFKLAFAARRRLYAKHLMGAARAADARSQLGLSVFKSGGLVSSIKSAGLYGCTLLPRPLQPKWPAPARS